MSKVETQSESGDSSILQVHSMDYDTVKLPAGGNVSGSDLLEQDGKVRIRLPESKRDKAMVMLRRSRREVCKKVREEPNGLDAFQEYATPQAYKQTRHAIHENYDSENKTVVLTANQLSTLYDAFVVWKFDCELEEDTEVGYVVASVKKAQYALLRDSL